ncbi:hypothetical protein [Ruegeria sp. HKCCA0370]|uniref:hypothetical protein n=1 Tax=Ruegeria sp. HKCCA0370 TaxID=2682995 RepID=UPI001487A90A|nr:hypothetical protein [Ruegeria sp. HKCCA0370]
MSDSDFEGVTDLDLIAEEFDIPVLPQLVENNEKVAINTAHLTGWIDEGGERFFVLPCLDFIPLENGSGFQIRQIHAEVDTNGNTVATVSTFYKGDEEGEYRAILDDEGCVLEEKVILSKDEASEELPEFPPRKSIFTYTFQ